MVYNVIMKALIDTHTHSIASGHHTSDTVSAMAKRASEIGLPYLCLTEHAPKMIGTTNESYFMNLKYADKVKYGVNLIYGAELNVLNPNGQVDLKRDITSKLAFCIASLHKSVFRPSTEAENTRALIKAMDNPDVFIIGHPDDPDFKIESELLTQYAKEKGVAIEINSAGLSPNGYREENRDWLFETLLKCKKKGVFVTLGSDSHGKDRIADFDACFDILKQADFPEELVLNLNVEKFFGKINEKRTFF